MLMSYLVVAFRNLRRHKGYSFINVAGLALGIACCVFIALFVQSELGFDRFHAGADRIYRIGTDLSTPAAPPNHFPETSPAVGSAIRLQYPEAEAVARLARWDPIVKHDGKYFFDDRFLLAEPTFLDVFSFPLVAGDTGTALSEPYTLVLTATTARKYFGAANPVGRSLILDDTLTYTITAVLSDVPENSHIEFDAIASWDPPTNDAWLDINSYAYVLLKAGTDAESFAANVSDLIMRNLDEQLRKMGIEATVALEPLTRIHLYSKRGNPIGPEGDIRYIYVFSAIALFVLLIACVNFMNLSTARSIERAKEVGVRKVVGSSRAALIRQFLSESILLAFIGLMVSLALVAIALPFFNELSEKEITLWALFQPAWLLLLLALALFVGLFAGSYPAFALSGFRPVHVLKGAFKTSRHGVRIRQGLVVLQFAVSVSLIVATLIVRQQLDYMRGQELGFDKEQVIVVDATGVPTANSYVTVKRELAQHPAVSSVSASNTVPGRSTFRQGVFAEGLTEAEIRGVRTVFADQDFLRTMDIELAAGRALSETFETDVTQAVLVNESAVRSFGWASNDEAIGKWIDFGDAASSRQIVVGVVKDYHHFSLKEKIDPMVLRVRPQTFEYFSVRSATDDMPAILGHLESRWERLFPGYGFRYFFLDSEFESQYVAEVRLTRIFGTFAFLAILIACLGLFGLASFVAAQRTKEIGVRKVLGASISGLVLLLSKDFAKLVIVALVIAAPLAYYAVNQWLQDFPYRIGISPTVFVIAGSGALLIAVMTVSYESIKAAIADPVKSLRNE